MGGPFSSYVDATHPSTPALLGHAIADQIQQAHAKGLADELVSRQKLVDQFQAIENDQSYDAKAREEARNWALQLKFLKPTDKLPKQLQIDKDGRIPALIGVTYRKAMKDGPLEPPEPAEPQDPMGGGGGGGSAAGSSAGGPPASISPMPDLGLGGSGGGGGSPGLSLPPIPGGVQPMPGRISPSPAVPGSGGIEPPPQIDAGGRAGQGQAGPSPSALPPPPIAPSELAAGQPPGTVSTRMSPIDLAHQQANIKAIESMVPISREQANEMGVHGAPDWPGMPGMVAVHPKVLEGTRYSLDRQARMAAQGIDPNTMERLPWKQQFDEAALQMRQAQIEGQRLANANKPKEALALMMRANAAMIDAEAARRRAEYNPYMFLGGGMSGGASSNGSNAGGSGGPENSDDYHIRTTVSGRQYVDATGYKGNVANAIKERYESMGIPVIQGKEADSIKQIDAVRLDQSSMLQQVIGMLPADAAERPEAYIGNTLAKIFQTDERIAAFGAWRGAAIRSLRATAGSEGLRMNEAEILLAVANDLPLITDTLGTAKQKMRYIMAQLDNIEAAHLVPRREGMAGSKGDTPNTEQKPTAPPLPANASVPPPPAKRVVGKTTWTDPKGILRIWNGVGWARVKEQPAAGSD